MEGIYRLRYLVYSLEKGWAPAQDTGMEIDSYDNENSIYVAVTIAEESGKARVIGCQRAIPLQFKVMLDDEFKDLVAGVPLNRESAIEITRLTIAKEFRRYNIDFIIYRGLVKWSRDNGIVHWYLVMEPKYLKFLNRLGIEAVQIGKEKTFDDGVTAIAVYIDLPRVLERQKTNNPKLHRFIMIQ